MKLHQRQHENSRVAAAFDPSLQSLCRGVEKQLAP
jgi:hypothetical protein